MELPADLLQRPSGEALRRVALALLDQASAAGARLSAEDDREALHDFRVALRRLRSTLALGREELAASVGRKQRRALREMQRRTGAGRDAEVALLWLKEQRGALEPGRGDGLEALAKEVARKAKGAKARGARSLLEDFAGAAETLRERLAVLEVHLDGEGSAETYGAWLARRARSAVREVADLASGVRGAEDDELLHEVRIACKRLRYLVEPARSFASESEALVESCRELQDLLGAFQDRRTLRADLPELAGKAARGGAEGGIDELDRRLDGELEALAERFRESWQRGGLERLEREVEAFSRAALARSGEPVEIERKYLLSGLPALPAEGERVEIEQGWLPGERLRERIRVARARGGARYFRTIKLGQGLRRLELEEEIDEQLFGALWPLTEGCRVRKRRHVVQSGARCWEVDEFLDRPLVLAEVELESEAEELEPPAWLAAWIVREVTEEPAYTNLSLARSGSVPAETASGQ